MRKVISGLALAFLVLAAGIWGYRQFVLIPALRAPVLARMTDPDSAKFQSETYVGPWSATNGTLCGQVNAKNRMGGYTGYHWFETVGQSVIFIEDDSLKEMFDSVGHKRCDTAKMDGIQWWWLRI